MFDLKKQLVFGIHKTMVSMSKLSRLPFTTLSHLITVSPNMTSVSDMQEAYKRPQKRIVTN